MNRNRWFVLACVAVVGLLAILAVATRFQTTTVGIDPGQAYVVDSWKGKVYWLLNDEARPVNLAPPTP